MLIALLAYQSYAYIAGEIDRYSVALDAVKLPAIFLIVGASISVLGNLYGLFFPVMTQDQVAEMLNDPNVPQWAKWFAVGPPTRSLDQFGRVLGVVNGAFIIFGAVNMMRLQSLGLAMAASFLSVIPCLGASPCCCLAIPFGIWSLVVLSKPQVKMAFN